MAETRKERSERLIKEAWHIKDLERWGYVSKGTTDQFIRRWFLDDDVDIAARQARAQGEGETKCRQTDDRAIDELGGAE